MKPANTVTLFLGLGCALALTSGLEGQPPGMTPPRVGDNRPWGLEQPRFRAEPHTPGVRSPAEEVHDFMHGGPLPGAEVVPPQKVPLPPEAPSLPIVVPKLPPPPSPRQIDSSSSGAIALLIGPLAALLAAIASGLARQREEAAQKPGRPPVTTPPQRASDKVAFHPYVQLGADGKGGIMYRDRG